MTPFRQQIRQGQRGSDVTAVKRAMVKLHVQRSGGMITKGKQASYAGHTFTGCVKTLQRNHKLHQDGIYGKQTHELVAPSFDAYGNLLYRRARLRHPDTPAVPATAAAAAKRLLELNAAGKYHDDRGTGLAQLVATSQGKAVWSPLGMYVHLDVDMLQSLCWLIDTKGHRIGTFAFCTDHGPDSVKGHAGGHAVDISSIDGVSVTSTDAKPKVVAVLKALHGSSDYKPWQLISGGYANHRDSDCSALSLPAADAYYGAGTMLQHTNHIHCGA